MCVHTYLAHMRCTPPPLRRSQVQIWKTVSKAANSLLRAWTFCLVLSCVVFCHIFLAISKSSLKGLVEIVPIFGPIFRKI